jgi:hypothetical protein
MSEGEKKSEKLKIREEFIMKRMMESVPQIESETSANKKQTKMSNVGKMNTISEEQSIEHNDKQKPINTLAMAEDLQ